MRYEDYVHDGKARERSAQEIQDDLEAIRQEMGETLHLLEARVSPRAVLDEVIERVRGGGGNVSQFAENLGATVRDNPVPVLLLATGAVSLLAAERSGRQGRPRGSTGEIASRGKQAAEKLRGSVGARIGALGEAAPSLGDGGGQARQGAEEVKGELQGKTAQARERAGQLAHGLQDQGRHARERMRTASAQARERGSKVTHEEPLVLVGLGLALGAMFGAGAPATRREQALLGPVSEAIKGGMREGRASQQETRSEEAAPEPPGASAEPVEAPQQPPAASTEPVEAPPTPEAPRSRPRA